MPGAIIDKVIKEALIQENVGKKIRELRSNKKLNTVTLASKADISQGQLSKIENGKATISIKNLTQLCSILEIPLNYLFQEEEESVAQKHIISAVAGLENHGLHWFSREIIEYTNGAVVLNPMGPFQFGTFADQIKYGFKGNLDLFIEVIELFESMAPSLKHLVLPYCFRSEENRQAFLKTRFFQEKIINRLLKNGIRVLNPKWNWMRGMEKVLLSRKPIISPEDIKGLRVRIYASDVLARFWKNMGAIPVNIPWSKVNDALKNREVDLLPTMKSLLYHNGYCEYARYVTLLGDIPSILGVFISEEKYRSFSPDIQDSLGKACDSAGEIFSHNVELLEKKNEKSNLSHYGAAYLKVDKLPWRLKTIEIRKKMMDQGILSKHAWQEMENAC
ncbi:MAG: TRAP transporter substrate-binding protein DctP [Deltaproteobacteria bacterium]|uniref:TRAP transporter substrate-binding protein DctP n=1 Tax=Desulfobacula sp. TaxID=2593537 RepID=UPI0019937610|nr:TRAP transporter substrate-binding protein DctP [Candidatus Desulfobacula maris]MBL6992685.1 TRAP transporter substrate-binding protein DctP [Desulfobacula sp.]